MSRIITYDNTVQTIPNEIGYCLYRDTTNKYIYNNGYPYLNIDENSQKTFLFWIYPTRYGYTSEPSQMVFYTGAWNSTDKGRFYLASFRDYAFMLHWDYWQVSNGTRYGIRIDTVSSPLNQWTQIAIHINGKDANNWKIYFNEVEQGKTIYQNNLPAGAKTGINDLYMWGNNSQNNSSLWYGGRFAVVNKLLSVDELKKIRLSRFQALPDFPELQSWVEMNCQNGKTVKPIYGGYNFSLYNYTDAETASNGQPQSGQTAWRFGNNRLPINDTNQETGNRIFLL